MKQPIFNLEAEDKYNELKNFRLEVNNIFKLYSMPQTEQIAIIKNGWAEKGLQFLELLAQDRTRKMKHNGRSLNNIKQ